MATAQQSALIDEAIIDELKAQLETGVGTPTIEFFNDNNPATVRASITLTGVTFSKSNPGGAYRITFDGAPFTGSSTDAQAPTKFRVKNGASTEILAGTLGRSGTFDMYTNESLSGSGNTYRLNDAFVATTGTGSFQFAGSLTVTP